MKHGFYDSARPAEKFHDMLEKTDNDYRHSTPQDSYSRQLDSRVQESEMPYGYSYGEPMADTGDSDARAYETKMQKIPRR